MRKEHRVQRPCCGSILVLVLFFVLAAQEGPEAEAGRGRGLGSQVNKAFGLRKSKVVTVDIVATGRSVVATLSPTR